MTHGTISFIELGSGAESQKSSAFFGQLFGWTFNAMGESGGWFDTPTIKAGLHANDPQPQIYPFFQVANLLDAIAQVRALGGEAEEPGPVEDGFGQFSNCCDPQGIKFGLHAKP